MDPELEHELVARDIPEQLQSRVVELVTEQCFDAGRFVAFSPASEGGQMNLVAATEMQSLETAFLIDHSWSFDTAETAIQSLVEVPREQLFDRLAAMVPVEAEASPVDLMERLLPLVQQYQVPGGHTVCFVMDEVGSRLTHAPAPECNCKVVPFLHASAGIAYSVCWPVANISVGEKLTAEILDDALSEELAIQLKQVSDPNAKGAEQEALVLWHGTLPDVQDIHRVGVACITHPPGVEFATLKGSEQRAADCLAEATSRLQVSSC